MKKNTSFCYALTCLILICNTSCAQQTKENKDAERIYFTNTYIDPIMLPLQLNDSITINSIFDTGGYRPAIHIDSTFFATHSIINPEVKPSNIAQGKSSWTQLPITTYLYKSIPTVKIKNTNLTYNQMRVYNQKIYYADTKADCIFNIPANDSTHIWEINFQHNYIEIHADSSFHMPSNCYVLPIIKGKKANNPFNIKLPLKIKCSNGDTLTIERTFMIDTGMSWDIALLYGTEEQSFFNKQKDAVWTGYAQSYHRHYSVEATLFDKIKIDSLRIYTLDSPYKVSSDYLVGTNFLKRFNVFFDLKKQLIGLQPISNFQRIVNPKAIRYHLAFDYTPQKTLVIRHIADYKENYFKNAGLQKGDEIVAINGKPYKNITRKEEDKMYMQDSIVYSINRKGKRLKIVVPIDHTEVQGD